MKNKNSSKIEKVRKLAKNKKLTENEIYRIAKKEGFSYRRKELLKDIRKARKIKVKKGYKKHIPLKYQKMYVYILYQAPNYFYLQKRLINKKELQNYKRFNIKDCKVKIHTKFKTKYFYIEIKNISYRALLYNEKTEGIFVFDEYMSSNYFTDLTLLPAWVEQKVNKLLIDYMVEAVTVFINYYYKFRTILKQEKYIYTDVIGD